MSYPIPSRILRLAVLSLAAGAWLAAPALAAGTGGASPSSGGTSTGSAQSGNTARHRSRHASRRRRLHAPRASAQGPATGFEHLGERTLREGMRGHDVRVLQDFLTRAGFPTGVDGDFGPSTKTSVIGFEQSISLPGDGVVTPTVAHDLREAVAQATAADQPSGPPQQARLNADGTVTAPSDAPRAVKEVIAAANKIAFKPYTYGGGHGSWDSSGYDCSGSVSYALHGGNLLSSPYDSSQFESYGRAGSGQWITLWANSGHAYMEVAGLYFDTAGLSDRGDRWTRSPASPTSGYVVRHPAGY